MEAIADTGKPVVFCLLAGSDLNLKYAAENLMQSYYCGTLDARAGRQRQRYCLEKSRHQENFR